jgi:predicted nucleotidyltransferase
MLPKYAYFRVLCYFLENPTKEVYVRELSRILKISPYTSNNALKTFHKENLLELNKKGRAHFYKLKNDSYFVKHLKVTYILSKINSISFKFSNEIVSIAIYGSYASGEFDEKSDLDLLIISSEKKDYPEIYKKIEDKLRISVSPLVLTPFEWQELSKKDKEFYIEVLKNYILIYGSELVV